MQHLKGEDGLSALAVAAAIRRLAHPVAGTGQLGGDRSALLGNLGGLHQRLGKPHTALLYYSRALREALGGEEHQGLNSSSADEDDRAPPQPLPERQVSQ